MVDRPMERWHGRSEPRHSAWLAQIGSQLSDQRVRAFVESARRKPSDTK